MSLQAAVFRLKPDQVKELADTMYEACVAMELGGSYKEVFRRAKHRKVGSMRKMYERMEKATPRQISSMADHLIEGQV
jgi:hypothetical protein